MTLSPEEFDILRKAMGLARSLQISKAKKLQAKLVELYPGKEENINRVLSYLGDQLRRTA